MTLQQAVSTILRNPGKWRINCKNHPLQESMASWPKNSPQLPKVIGLVPKTILATLFHSLFFQWFQKTEYLFVPVNQGIHQYLLCAHLVQHCNKYWFFSLFHWLFPYWAWNIFFAFYSVKDTIPSHYKPRNVGHSVEHGWCEWSQNNWWENIKMQISQLGSQIYNSVILQMSPLFQVPYQTDNFQKYFSGGSIFQTRDTCFPSII